MKKYLKLKSLTVREVPQELDLRIIAAARLRQGSGQARRKFLRWTISAAAAAAGVFIAIGICFSQVDTGFNPKLTQEEYARLMAMTDWTDIEQENFNLTGEITCGTKSVVELADNRMQLGGLEL